MSLKTLSRLFAVGNNYLPVYFYLSDDGLRSRALIAHIGPVLVEPVTMYP